MNSHFVFDLSLLSLFLISYVTMRALIFVLILLSFFQATFLPLNLVLLIISLRAYIKVDKTNLYLAFFLGLLVSLLLQDTLGIYCLIFLISITIAHLTTKSPFSRHNLTVLPLSLLILLMNYIIVAVFKGQFYLPIQNLIIETFLSLPIYIVLRTWEERFVVKQEIKLKI